MSQYLALAEMEYVAIVGNDEEVIPGNIHALMKGLQAMLSDDARNRVRANELWDEAEALLSIQRERETGAGATGAVQVADDFALSCMSGYAETGIYWGN